MRSLFFIVTFFILGFVSFAQSKQDAAYKKNAEEFRKSVWSWSDPKFKSRIIPNKYLTASKVILVRHIEINGDVKGETGAFYFGGSRTVRQNITRIDREIVLLNDKSAITEYSELSFTKLDKTQASYKRDGVTTYLGVRVIKKDGSIKEVNADEVVLTKDERDEKQAKLAVPDLQVGDILDYYFATVTVVTNEHDPFLYTFFFFDDAPMLNCSVHVELGKKYSVKYKGYNNAPQLKVSKNEDKDMVLHAEMNDVPPFETSLWVSPMRQLPVIRMNVLPVDRGAGYKKGEVEDVNDNDFVMNDFKKDAGNTYMAEYYNPQSRQWYKQLISDGQKMAKDAGIDYKLLSPEEKAAFLYYVFRYKHLLSFKSSVFPQMMKIGEYVQSTNQLHIWLFFTFFADGQDPVFLLSEKRFGVRLNEMMNYGDAQLSVYLPEIKKFLHCNSIFDYPFSAPLGSEGIRNTLTARLKTGIMLGLSNIIIDPGPVVPITSADSNLHRENLSIALSPEKSLLQVKRKTTLKGFYKEASQTELITYEDLYNYERKAFKIEGSLIDDLKENKRTAKDLVTQVENTFKETRAKQKESFIKEAKDWFEQEVTDFKDYTIENPGVRHSSPDFVYSSNFMLGGMVKKAGNNFIVEIGKILGSQLVVKEAQRNRSLDVYMPFARTIEFVIDFNIPEGYTAEGVESLNTKVENETGGFFCEAVMKDGKTISIHVKKTYFHNFEPAGNFAKLTSFLDVAVNWGNSKILFKKK